jgi:pyridoxal phosphate enzyme (YggS family)
MDIQLSFSDIQKKIAHYPSARLLAVSKFQSEEKIRKLYELGQRSFGENYVQEFLKKRQNLSDLTEMDWHFIGHLQTNKAKDVVGFCELIHSVDSLKLLEKLNSVLENGMKAKQRILLQINLADEDSKSGFSEEDLRKMDSRYWNLPYIQICGLMTLPPLQNQPEENRPYFRRLKKLLDELNQSFSQDKRLVELSMGTSHDFHIALEEGATLVRLGTVLFGERTP